MRKAALAIMALTGLLIAILLLSRDAVAPIAYIPPLPLPEKGLGGDALALIDRINAKRAGNKTFRISSLPIRLRQGGTTTRCSGNLTYEAEKNFRLIVSHRITGKELEIGSNSSGFWFWSKRMDPPAIYFCEHKNLTKSNLKTPLNPEWLIKAMNICPLDPKKVSGQTREGDRVFLYESSRDGSNRDVNYIYETKLSSAEVVSVSLGLLDGTPIATAKFFGSKTRMEWPEEDMAMEWDTSSSEYNVKLNKELWRVPTYTDRIDMGY